MGFSLLYIECIEYIKNIELKSEMKKINPKVVTAVMLLLGVLVAGSVTAIKEGAPATATDISGSGDIG